MQCIMGQYFVLANGAIEGWGQCLVFQCSVFQCLVFQYFVFANGAIEGVRSVLSLRTGRLPSKWVVLAQN